MCGISGLISKNRQAIENLDHKLEVMNNLQRHRGPDGHGIWSNHPNFVGLSHQRLAIIDISSGKQPMTRFHVTCVFNGEIYNFVELRDELSTGFCFTTNSDTEVLIAAYLQWGEECLNRFRGMFAFALWDEKEDKLFIARDQFGIKPLYYFDFNNDFGFASECKTLLPFLPEIATDDSALVEYLTFQLPLGEKTLFKNIKQLLPGHCLSIKNGSVKIRKYWEIDYAIDYDHTRKYFKEKLRHLIEESIALHMRSDVPVAAYISGGIDSSAVAALASRHGGNGMHAFVGKFSELGESYDESKYARDVASQHGIQLFERNIVPDDFQKYFEKLIYHLDYPVAGPGSFAQFCVSELASQKRKVILGGQGGDEIFGGYTRYLVAYFEQCIKGAIEGNLNSGNFIVTYESIIPNLTALNSYKPMLKDFFKEGLFEPHDKRYFRLVSRSPDLGAEIKWENLPNVDLFGNFSKIFNGNNVGKESYFDKMTHFDFKTLLPALLHVEDRVSMAWGLESRVPLIEKDIINFAATMPADIKFKDGTLKMILIETLRDLLPPSVLGRKDKMGFPVPINKWLSNDLSGFTKELFSAKNSSSRSYYDRDLVLKKVDNPNQYSRTLWGLLSLEVWHQQFHDKEYYFKSLIKK